MARAVTPRRRLKHPTKACRRDQHSPRQRLASARICVPYYLLLIGIVIRTRSSRLPDLRATRRMSLEERQVAPRLTRDITRLAPRQ